MRKTFLLLVCIRMYTYVSRMYPYVTRMLVVVLVCIRIVRMLLVCYSYVTRMYSCGVLVMIYFTQPSRLSASGHRDALSLPRGKQTFNLESFRPP